MSIPSVCTSSPVGVTNHPPHHQIFVRPSRSRWEQTARGPTRPRTRRRGGKVDSPICNHATITRKNLSLLAGTRLQNRIYRTRSILQCIYDDFSCGGNYLRDIGHLTRTVPCVRGSIGLLVFQLLQAGDLSELPSIRNRFRLAREAGKGFGTS